MSLLNSSFVLESSPFATYEADATKPAVAHAAAVRMSSGAVIGFVLCAQVRVGASAVSER
jgi:hypothetical protein